MAVLLFLVKAARIDLAVCVMGGAKVEFLMCLLTCKMFCEGEFLSVELGTPCDSFEKIAEAKSGVKMLKTSINSFIENCRSVNKNFETVCIHTDPKQKIKCVPSGCFSYKIFAYTLVDI